MSSFEKPPQLPCENKPEQIINQVNKSDLGVATFSKTKEALDNAKEKLSTHLKHQSLKIKEYFGFLN